MRYPVTVIDFQDMFPTEESCYEYLCLVRWPEGFECPHCGHNEAWQKKGKLKRCKKCRKDVSVTAGTVFQDLRKPLREVFQAMWYVVCQKNGVSALGLKDMLGLSSYQTAWAWLHKLRRAMVRPGRDKLSGEVEVDETYVGGVHSGKRGRGAEGKTLVLVAVELTDYGLGRIRLKHIPNAGGATLNNSVQELVESGSTVNTDGWKGYHGLSKAGYNHQISSHSELEVGEDPTANVHRVASLLKRWLLGTHQGGQQAKYLEYYLDEFTFRFNRRRSRSRGKLFLSLIQQALTIEPVTLSNIKSS